MRVYFHTFGCKANQYDTERMRQELEARGATNAQSRERADVCVVNTCTVTNQADAEARRFIRRLERERPGVQVVVAGCSAALKGETYRSLPGVVAVVAGQDPVEVANAAALAGHPTSAQVAPSMSVLTAPRTGDEAAPSALAPAAPAPLVQIGTSRSLDRMAMEPVGASVLAERAGATRAWLKIQDGCDRKCAFCATRLARGASRSRDPAEVVREARALSQRHPELVLTGIHIGHYGRDLGPGQSLSRLVARLLDAVPDVRFRLGSVEATEVDALLLELLATSGGRLAPHLHMPLQSGADPVLRRMRRWHSREAYRSRALEIAERLPLLGLGADVITGFPGETDEDHASTRDLIEELPYTYLHVFPFSPRDGTVAATLTGPVPQRVAGERARELRELAHAKGRAYRTVRSGGWAELTLERGGRVGLTGDYLRVDVVGEPPSSTGRLHRAKLHGTGDGLSAWLEAAA